MAETWNVRSMLGVGAVLVAAQDGDTIRLVWPDVNWFNKLAVESMAMGLGLDVVVEVAPESTAPFEVGGSRR